MFEKRLLPWLRQSSQHYRKCAHMAAECWRTSAALQGTRTWHYVLSFPKRHMFATNMLVSATLTPASDFMVQKHQGLPVDECRLRGFFFFGIVQGVTSWLVYVSCFIRCFPLATRLASLPLREKFKDLAGLRQLCWQIVLDLAVYVPFVHFPAFYCVQGTLRGETSTTSLSRWWKNLPEDAAGGAMFWLPLDVLCFMVPMWLRMPVGYFSTFWYAALISVFRGDPGSGKEERESTTNGSKFAGTCRLDTKHGSSVAGFLPS
mmetsp:Transcript_27870/g.49432  ORF Transcript_27870/g.49432 Transcript_27870/m.49432 type:complete len:261 (+) Transcript_27870:19-801(+)